MCSCIQQFLLVVDRLADCQRLRSKTPMPAVAHARKRQPVTAQEEAVPPGPSVHQRNCQIRKRVDSGKLQPIKPSARQDTIGFAHNMLLPGAVRSLTKRLQARGDDPPWVIRAAAMALLSTAFRAFARLEMCHAENLAALMASAMRWDTSCSGDASDPT